jgi:flagellar biosynthesis protein FliQ
MTPDAMTDMAIGLGRDAIWMSLLIAAPVLLAGMVVGLVIGLLQAVTQIQEQTVAFVPKMVIMVLVLSFTMPWLLSQMVHYATELIAGIPGRF